MSKITIGKKEYEVSEVQLNQCELLFYEENPRVYSARAIRPFMTGMKNLRRLEKQAMDISG